MDLLLHFLVLAALESYSVPVLDALRMNVVITPRLFLKTEICQLYPVNLVKIHPVILPQPERSLIIWTIYK